MGKTCDGQLVERVAKPGYGLLGRQPAPRGGAGARLTALVPQHAAAAWQLVVQGANCSICGRERRPRRGARSGDAGV